MSSSPNYLFREGELQRVIEKRRELLQSEVDGFDKDYLLNTPVEDVVDYLEDEYRLDVPKFDEGGTYVANHGETDIDVSHDRSRAIRDRSQPFYIKGGFVEIAVPFEGDPNLFKHRPSTYSTMPPTGRIQDLELRLRYKSTQPDQESVQSSLNRDLSNIKKCLSRVDDDTAPFNDSLRGKARSAIEKRRERILKHEGMVASLDLPIKRRNDTSDTYAAPVSRKRIRFPRPPKTNEPAAREPLLADDIYEEVLDVIRSMVEVMERSPRAFESMCEEDMRTHILVQLNNQFEGEATGETFNYDGKTDIHVRTDGKNVFIAECKFWRGPKGFRDTIDQLLGYLSWRDTKTALIIFNRNKNLTSVLEKIPPILREHPNFRREVNYESETEFRFALHHKNDEKREITVTVMVFDVPRA